MGFNYSSGRAEADVTIGGAVTTQGTYVLGDNILYILEGAFDTFTILGENPTLTPIKMFEFTINTLYPSPTTIRITYQDKKFNTAVENLVSEIYINGVATGLISTSTGTSYVTRTIDVTIEEGDLLQIYVYSVDSLPTRGTIKDIKITGDILGASLPVTLTREDL